MYFELDKTFDAKSSNLAPVCFLRVFVWDKAEPANFFAVVLKPLQNKAFFIKSKFCSPLVKLVVAQVVVLLRQRHHEGRVGLNLAQDDVLDGGAGTLVGLQVGQLADRHKPACVGLKSICWCRAAEM